MCSQKNTYLASESNVLRLLKLLKDISRGPGMIFIKICVPKNGLHNNSFVFERYIMVDMPTTMVLRDKCHAVSARIEQTQAPKRQVYNTRHRLHCYLPGHGLRERHGLSRTLTSGLKIKEAGGELGNIGRFKQHGVNTAMSDWIHQDLRLSFRSTRALMGTG